MRRSGRCNQRKTRLPAASVVTRSQAGAGSVRKILLRVTEGRLQYWQAILQYHFVAPKRFFPESFHEGHMSHVAESALPFGGLALSPFIGGRRSVTKRLPKQEDLEAFPGCQEAKRHKKMYGLTPDQLREMARALEAAARRIHNVADDMHALSGMGFDKLPMIPQALCTLIYDQLPEYVDKEVTQRHDAIVKKIGRQEARRSG
jgi:hypothetical protein